jgi:hypothetical protein
VMAQSDFSEELTSNDLINLMTSLAKTNR